MRFRRTLLIATTALMPAIAFAQSSNAPVSNAAPAMSTQALTAADFVSKAASSNMFEIQSSQLALDKSQNSRVRDFAQKMIQDHTQAGDQMKAAAQGLTVPSSLDQQHAQMLQQLNSAGGADFDRRYVQLQLAGHEDTVRLFDQYAQNGDNAQLKQFAQRLLPDLREHLQMAQQLRGQLPAAQTAQGQSGQSPVAQAGAGGGNWITQEQPGQWRASKLRGVNIYNNNNEKIGDVNELIVDRDGRIQAVVVGIGGFLGIGEHDVAVPFNEIQWAMEPRGGVANSAVPPSATAPAGTAIPPRTANGTQTAGTSAPATTGSTAGGAAAPADQMNQSYPDHGVLNMSRDQLKAAPEFRYAR